MRPISPIGVQDPGPVSALGRGPAPAAKELRSREATTEGIAATAAEGDPSPSPLGVQGDNGVAPTGRRPRYETKPAAKKAAELIGFVEQLLEISNEFIHGFKAVIDFAINPSIRIR